jgi:hypothetical protein
MAAFSISTANPTSFSGYGLKPAHDPGRLRHTFWLYPRANGRVPHISLVFREMWDTAGLPLKPDTGSTTP